MPRGNGHEAAPGTWQAARGTWQVARGPWHVARFIRSPPMPPWQRLLDIVADVVVPGGSNPPPPVGGYDQLGKVKVRQQPDGVGEEPF